MSSSEVDPDYVLNELGVQRLLPLTGRAPIASQRRIGELVLRRMSSNGFSKPRGAVQNPGSVYWTSLVSGKLVVPGRGQTAVLTPHISTVRRGIGSGSVVADQDTDILLVEIPRVRLLDRGVDAESVLLPMDDLSRHTQGYLLFLLSSIGNSAPEVDACLGNAAIEMIAAMLMGSRGFQPGSASILGTLRLRAEAAIQRECADPAMTPQVLADRLHVSLRTLQRAYGEAEETIAGRMRHHRVRHAERLFASEPALSVDQVAGRSGFPSAYAMRTALQRSRGMNIRDFRLHLQNTSVSDGPDTAD